MNLKFGDFGLVVVLILLVGFNVNLIGADSLNGSVVDGEDLGLGDGGVLGEEEELGVVEVVDKGETLNNVSEDWGDVEYVDIDEVNEFVGNASEEDSLNYTEDVNLSGVGLDLNESAENVSVAENVSFDNNSVWLNVSFVLGNVSGASGHGGGSGGDVVDLEVENVSRDIDSGEVLEKKRDLIRKYNEESGAAVEYEEKGGFEPDIEENFVGEFEKDFVISSEEHFEDSLRVWSNLPSPAREEDIVVTWENEGEIVRGLRYYYGDSELVERISWVVPHLSTQRYRIEIVVGGNESSGFDNIILSVNSPDNGSVVPNPIVFNVSVDYSDLSNVRCTLRIDDVVTGMLVVVGEENFSNISLGCGEKNWSIVCKDALNTNISNSTSGYFNVSNFSINGLEDFYFNSQDVSGAVSSQGNFSLKLRRGSHEESVSHNGGVFLIDSSNISVPGDYELIATSDYYEEDISVSRNFSVGSLGVSFSPNVKEDVDVDFVVSVGGIGMLSYDLYVGGVANRGNSIAKTIVLKLSNGNHSVFLRNISVNGEPRSDINFGTIHVSNNGDTTDPDIDLIFPKEGEILHNSDITFKYRVAEANGIANCSLKIYNSTKNFGMVDNGDLIFPNKSADMALAINTGVRDNVEVGLRLIDFDTGYYAYEVSCFDNAGNKGWYLNYFSVDLNGTNIKLEPEANYERKAEIEKLIENINSFLEKEDNFTLEEKRVLGILGLERDMSFWKKRVVQMDQDLKYNLKYMEAEKRAKRIKEIYDEVDEIEGKIVLNVRSIDSYEFSKNSVDLDLEEVIGTYMEESGVSMGKSSLKSLASYNEDLQKDLVVGVEAWKLELEYLDGKKEIVLVNKNLDVNGEDSVVLEVIPEKYVDDVKMVSSVEKVGENIYSVDVSNLEDGNLVYYFEKGFSLKEVEKMESVLFGEGSSSGFGSITGMFIGVGNSVSFGSFFWLPLFLFIGYLGFLVFGKVKLEVWKKEPGVEELVRLINETSRLIREGRVEVARSNYVRMGEIYKALPVKCRDFFYKELKRIHLAINKKDVLNLIREYEAAKDSFRKDDAMALHDKINAIYRKLPRKFQEKVYRRLVKREV